MTPARIERHDAILLVVDLQTRLFPHITDRDRIEQQTIRMIQAARELALPILISEQYREGLGPTLPSVVAAAADAPVVAKLTFSVCGDTTAMKRLETPGRRQVLLAGIEAHVCVQQTALDLLRRGLTPVVLADAVSSRRALDRDIAFDRMRQAAVVITTVESAIFEMMRDAGTELFKRILPLVR
jgi:nicotinamidase-related amidase